MWLLKFCKLNKIEYQQISIARPNPVKIPRFKQFILAKIIDFNVKATKALFTKNTIFLTKNTNF